MGARGTDLDRIDTAHLACADTDDLAGAGVDNGVGLDVFRNFPGEFESVPFGIGGGALGDDLGGARF